MNRPILPIALLFSLGTACGVPDPIPVDVDGEGEGEGFVGEGEGEVSEGEGEVVVGAGSCGAPRAVSCGDELVLDTADGFADVDAFGCDDIGVSGFSYPGRGYVFAFAADRPVAVDVSATREGSLATTWQLFDLGTGGNACGDIGCVDVRDANDPAPLHFESTPGATRLLAFDARVSADATTPFSLHVICADAGCGDGSPDDGEACDDGNDVDGDGCSACVVDPGFACDGAPSLCAAVVCGDGVVSGDEGCDDNAIDGDGCTGCVVDDGYACGGSPSVCVVGDGEQCTGAVPLDGNGSLSFASDGFDDDIDTWTGACVSFGAAGPDVFFSVDVPPRQVLRASLPASFDGARLVVARGCDGASSCLAGSSDRVAFANHGAATESVVVVVDGFLGDTNFAGAPREPDAGAFTLATTTEALSAQASTAVCETAALLQPGVVVAGTTVGHDNTALGFGGGSCGFGATPRTGQGKDAFYRITVPAQRRLRVAVTDVSGSGDVAVGIVSDCADPRATCLADADRGSQLDDETAVFDNGGAAREVFVVVDAISDSPGFSFNLTATVE